MNKKKALSSGELYRKYGILIIMIILFVASAVINHNFLKPQNLLNILKQISVVTIIACGETMLIVSGMIDLSAGFLCTTSACVSAGVLASTGHLSLALLVGIVIGCVCGWINGFLITYYKLQPFIATLAMTYVLKGIVQIYTNGQTIGGCEQSEIFRTWLYFGDSGSGSHYAPFCNCDRCSDEINKVWNLYLCDRWK